VPSRPISNLAGAYPRNMNELEAQFSDEEACRAYLFKLRWPDGFSCPRCGGRQGWPARDGRLMMCSACGRQTSVTAGTIFQDTRTPLTMWFRAAWLVTSQPNGISALTLQRQLGLGSYQTAWTWLHRFRRAMVRPGRDRLKGVVEVDETYFGGEEEGTIGRETYWKVPIVVAAEEVGRGIGRIRLRQIPDCSGDSLEAFIKEVVEPGSTIHTDGWSSYRGLPKLGYVHQVANISGSGYDAHELLPRVHRVIALLKRWLLGTHQGGVSAEHLDYYLDEFTFRFNRRRSRSRGMLFYRLLQQAVEVPPAPLDTLVGGIMNPKQDVGVT
jgi:transposase-like protein